MPRLPLRVEVGVAASIAAQLALAPIQAASFHRLSPAAVLLNMAAVPLSSAVLLSGGAVVVASPLGDGPADLAGDVAWCAAHALRLSGDLGPLGPWLDRRIPGPSIGLVLLHAAGLALLARHRRRPGLAALVAGPLVLAFAPTRPDADGRLHLTVVDVGQGDGLHAAVALGPGAARRRRRLARPALRPGREAHGAGAVGAAACAASTRSWSRTRTPTTSAARRS